MKLTQTFLPGMAAILLLSACNSEEYGGADIPGNKLNVSAGINEMRTRLSETGVEWTVGDAIGVSDNLASQPNTNIRYQAATTDGTFESTTGIYIVGGGETEYTAYYPYTGEEGTAAGSVNFSVADATGKYAGNDAVDFMFAKATAKREDAKVNFQFEHKMSRLVLNITDSKSGDTSTKITYTLKGVTTDGTFNTADGTVTAGTTSGNVSRETTIGGSSSVILPPATAASPITIVVKVGDKGYSGTINPALAASTQYTYNIDLGKSEAGKYLSVSSPTITGWTSVDGGDVNMKETIEYNPSLEVGDFICSDGTLIDKDYQLTDELKAKIAGVVFFTGNAQPSVAAADKYTTDQDVLKKEAPTAVNGLAIALKNAQDDPARFCSAKYAYTDWFKNEANAAAYISDNFNTTSPATVMTGYNNTRVIEAVEAQGISAGTTDFVTMLNAFRKANTVKGASQWYLPSYAELKAVQDNYAVIAASIAKAGGSLPQYNDFATTATGNFYWSSDMRGNAYSWVSPLVSTADDVHLFLGRTSSGIKGYFRLAVAF